MKTKAMGLAVAVCVLMLFGATAAPAAPEFYVSITGAKQGPFKGEVITKGFEGKIAGLNFDYSVVGPRDLASGMATAKRLHKPIRIKKMWGASSTPLFTALTTGEALTEVVIDFVTIDIRLGVLMVDHTFMLRNAYVTSIEHNYEALGATETVEFVFQQIELRNHRTKTAAGDSSLAP